MTAGRSELLIAVVSAGVVGYAGRSALLGLPAHTGPEGTRQSAFHLDLCGENTSASEDGAGKGRAVKAVTNS